MTFELIIEYPEGTGKRALEEHIKRTETGTVKAMTWFSKAARRLGVKVKLGAIESRIENERFLVFKVQAPSGVSQEVLFEKLKGGMIQEFEKTGIKISYRKLDDF